jgi:hypothetical protein
MRRFWSRIIEHFLFIIPLCLSDIFFSDICTIFNLSINVNYRNSTDMFLLKRISSNKILLRSIDFFQGNTHMKCTQIYNSNWFSLDVPSHHCYIYYFEFYWQAICNIWISFISFDILRSLVYLFIYLKKFFFLCFSMIIKCLNQ